MTIAEYRKQFQTDGKKTFDRMSAEAKKKNLTNPAVLRREDHYVESRQEEQFSKPLQGLPIVIKDNILLEGTISSCGSKMLGGYIAPYSATVVHKLEDAGALIIGKATMDEFAFGTTGENSPYTIPHNPYGSDRVIGGTSSGSAVAVASGMVPVALGTDTGGSIRLPASFCNIVGIKPTYGSLSRYGVQASASSFDQVGIMATNVKDARQIFEIVQGHDERDATTNTYPLRQDLRPIKGLRIGLPKQYFAQGLDPQIKDAVFAIVDKLVAQGAIAVELDIPLFDTGVAVYYTLQPAEASSNMARFDGMKFGHQNDTHESVHHHDYISQVRQEGFGDEVLRRILLGAHILSASEYEGLYVKAMTIRTTVTEQFVQHFEQDVDVIVGPVSPVLPWKLGSKNDDPLALYLADMYTVIANITGMPAMSIPIGFGYDGDEKLPIGLQLMGNHYSEYQLFDVAQAVEQLIVDNE